MCGGVAHLVPNSLANEFVTQPYGSPVILRVQTTKTRLAVHLHVARNGRPCNDGGALRRKPQTWVCVLKVEW